MTLALHSETQRVDNIFSLTERLSDDFELQAHWARYLAVVSAGYIEVCVKIIFGSYARQSSSPAVASYAVKQLESFRNANTERIAQLMRSFNVDWYNELESLWSGEAKDAVDSVINIRHNVAHGRNHGITIARITKYHSMCKIVVDYINTIVTR
jgi:hypothetical protein